MSITRIIGLIGVLILAICYSSIFVVDERQKALVLQFGQIKAVKENPGLAFKIPLIQEVVRYDDRILSLDSMPLEVTPLDDRRLVVDAFMRYRITDVVQFRQAVGTGGTLSAEKRLERILNAALREVLGSVGSNEVLSDGRVALMEQIRDDTISEALNLGIEIVDVRIKRADLPTQNLAATFQRMKAERERMAADERARGREAAQKVRAVADRTAVTLVSEAKRDSEIIRGQADAETTNIFAEAFGRDPEFYAFIRSLNAYEKAMTGQNTTIVMSPDSEFFDYMKESVIE
jgi:membrane protease subunit HflC